MSIGKTEFVEQLTESCPATLPIVAEHLLDYDNEVLLHLLIADVRRFAIERHEADDNEVLNQILDVVSRGLTDGDEYVENAVAVSFVEDTGWWDPKMEQFMAAWPLPLRQEAERQATWRSDHAQLPFWAASRLTGRSGLSGARLGPDSCWGCVAAVVVAFGAPVGGLDLGPVALRG